MGLDVNLVQFENLDTDAIIEFAKFAYEPPESRQHGASSRDKARELGLPERVIGADFFGGTPISYASKKHPKTMPVGEWYSFSGTREIIDYFTGRHLYDIFPEAIGNPPLLRPHWANSRNRLQIILDAVQKLNPAQIENFYENDPDSKAVQQSWPTLKPATAAELFAGNLAQIEVMIETLDYVLNHERPHEFLLRWSG